MPTTDPLHMSYGQIPGYRISIQLTTSRWYHIQVANRIRLGVEAITTKLQVPGMESHQQICMLGKIQEVAEEVLEQKAVELTAQQQVQELQPTIQEALAGKEAKQ